MAYVFQFDSSGSDTALASGKASGRSSATPDHSSIWRFRQRIEKLGLSEALLAEVNRQLDALGLIVKRGTLVDATIIAAAVKPPPIEEGQVSPRDPDASFTVENDETYFGYKAHLAVDEASGIVRQAEMTSADLHDSQRGEAMIQKPVPLLQEHDLVHRQRRIGRRSLGRRMKWTHQDVESRPLERLGDVFQEPAASRIGLDERVGERRLTEITARHRRLTSSECRRESWVRGFCKGLPKKESDGFKTLGVRIGSRIGYEWSDFYALV